jgi:beta-lactamase regulating signal transducer with metallopeptidase domain
VFNLARTEVRPERAVSVAPASRQGAMDGAFVEAGRQPSAVSRQLSGNGQVTIASNQQGSAIDIPEQPLQASGGPMVRLEPIVPAPSATAYLSSIEHLFVWCWIAGCLACVVRLLWAALALRRRLRVCRPVTDAAVLNLLETTSRDFRLRRSPALLVTPEPISPCLVGTWRPRIIVPESLIADVPQQGRARSPAPPLRQVLTHELAHVARGDQWTNWLLLTAGTLHWFNPLVWWTLRELRAERESACDDLALAVGSEIDPRSYAETLLGFVGGRVPSPIAPGMIGLFSSQRSLARRMQRVLQTPVVAPFRPIVAAALPLLLCLVGLTDAMPADEAGPVPAQTAGDPAAPPANAQPEPADYVIHGRCINDDDQSPLAGVSLRLYAGRGLVSPPGEMAATTSDEAGRFQFTGLVRPRNEMEFDRLRYMVVAQAEGRPTAFVPEMFRRIHPRGDLVVSIARNAAVLTGQLTNQRREPIVGATIFMDYGMRPIPRVNGTVTDEDGQFALSNLPAIDPDPAQPDRVSFRVMHPDHPLTTVSAPMLPADVEFVVPDGCSVTGQVLDKATGQPAPGVIVAAEHNRHPHLDRLTVTGAAGRFKLVVPEGDYNFLVKSEDQVCVGVTDQDCQVGRNIELPPLLLTTGGLISGRVVNTATGEPVASSEEGDPIRIGLFGPGHPPRKGVISPQGLAMTDDEGRFTIRAAEGDNFPFLVNTRGERMAWDTQEQAPIVVKEGETVAADILIVPEKTPAEKIAAARKIIAGLSDRTEDRVAQIIGEFRKLNHTVDETEIWCSLMRELVKIGLDAVPQLCDELDQTTEQRLLRRLGFALRAIGDPRAVPALVRAVPRTLLPSSSDYGLDVADAELMTFMQAHDLSNARERHFDFGRPIREIFGALHKLTGQDFGDETLNSMHLSANPRGQILQRRLYRRQALRWQEWWETHWMEFTSDEAYARVNLPDFDEPLPPAMTELGPDARTQGVWSGMVLSPSSESGRYVNHLMDLDTSLQPRWPQDIPRNEAAIEQGGLRAWAKEHGVDLMCVTYKAPDGTQSYVLRAFDMRVREISPRELRNLDRLVRAGTLPEGRPVGELLLHYDAGSQKLTPENGAFLYVTPEGTMGVIEVTDRVTRVADLTGMAGAPAGVGFHKGVRFNLTTIVP